MSTESETRSWVPLTPRERRVLGVLVEKAKTTPEYYPLTLAALVTGCNQKSNRDPVVTYDADDVEEILQGLRKKGAAVMVEAGGRVVRWKHTLYDWLKVGKVELAVLAELMLRGPQTEGDLRSRAARMETIADLGTLQTILETLAARKLVLYLSPPGKSRGVVVTHGLYPPEEAERVRQAFANQPIDDEPGAERAVRTATARNEMAATLSQPGWVAEVSSLRDELNQLRATVDTLTAELNNLKSALGI
ncbi:MAG: YceH family protein [Isosphaeraceae bacterium]